MKHNFTFFVLLGFWLTTPAQGQKTTDDFRKMHTLQPETVNRAMDRGGDTSLLIAERYYKWDVNQNIFSGGDSTKYSYDNNCNVTESLFYYYSIGLAAWTLGSRSVNDSYDLYNNNLHYVFQYWDGNSWQNSYQYTYVYNNSNQVTNEKDERWENGVWVLHNNTNFIYDNQGRLIEKSSFYGVDTYEYDANGNTILFTKKTTDLQNVYRRVSTYNVQNQLLSSISQSWNGNWNNLGQDLYTYDSNGYENSTISQIWIGSAWKNDYAHFFTKDASGNVIVYLSQYWSNNDWENILKSTHTYNASGNIIFSLSEDWSGLFWYNRLENVYEYDVHNRLVNCHVRQWVDSAWTVSADFQYYYADFVSTQTPAPAAFSLFPNPTTSAVILKGENLAFANIFDLQGRLLSSQRLQGHPEETIQLGNLPTGNYFLQVMGRDGKTGAKPLQIRH